MNVVLLTPPRRSFHGLEGTVPLGLAFMSAKLKTLGHRPTIIDCVADQLSTPAAARVTAEHSPDVIGLSVYTPELTMAQELVSELARRLPKVPLVAGGPHVTGLGVDAARSLAGVHYLISGEGELEFGNLLSGKRLQAGHSVEWRQAKPVEDINAWADWDTLQPARYYKFPAIGNLSTVYYTSRGCPFSCQFCDRISRSVRYRDLDTMWGEFMLLNRRFGITRFLLGDEAIGAIGKWTNTFFDYIERRDPNHRFSWAITSGLRLSGLQADTVKLLARANVEKNIPVGIESGSEKIRRAMRKNLSTEDIYSGVRLLKHHGFRPIGNFIVGYPGESEITIRQTENMAHKLKLHAAHFSPFIPYPGAPIWNQLKTSGELDDYNPDSLDINVPPYAPQGMTRQKLFELKREISLKFNLAPRRLLRHLRHHPMLALGRLRDLLR